jgi:hypothetical protein
LRTISALLVATDATASNRSSRLDLVRKPLARGSREFFHGLLGCAGPLARKLLHETTRYK